MSRNRQVAVVITTYNNPKSLELCLLSLARQTYRAFDVFIADDGSGDATRELIQRLKRELPFFIHHYWHPDEGYRKARINNTVFRDLDPARHPIVVGLDHDVIVHPRFIEDHHRAHERAGFEPLLFMGRRVDLGPEITAEIEAGNVDHFIRGLSWRLIRSGWSGETKNILRSVRLDAPAWVNRILKRDRVQDLLGSNFSISTRTLIEVNGYNEDFEGYWGEDGDLFVRVRNRGVPHYGVIGYAVQWHLYHKRLEETPEHIEKVRALLQKTDYVECRNGIRRSG